MGKEDLGGASFMFTNITDFHTQIKESRLLQLLDQEPTALDQAADTAEALVRDALYSRYDVAAIFATVGTDRPKQVVRWITVIALYYLYERLPDKVVPERVVKNSMTPSRY